MKKLLCGTTALIAVGALASGAAVAQDKKDGPIKLELGGYFQAEFSVLNEDDGVGQPGFGRRGHGILREAEVHFRGSTRFDNGLLVGLRVEIEAETCGDQIDESFLFFDSQFGRLEIGQTNSVATKMYYGPPGAIIAKSTAIAANRNYQVGGNLAGFLLTGRLGFDAGFDYEKVNYFTPRFAGFQVGASYTPDACEEGLAAPTGCGGSLSGLELDNEAGQQSEIWEIAANYVNKFGDVDLAVYAGYGKAKLEAPGAALNAFSPTGITYNDDRAMWGVGATVSYMGFTIGGTYKKDDLGTSGVAANPEDYTVWGLGAQYVTGPYRITAEYSSATVDLNAAALGGEDTHKTFTIAGGYTVGPGVALYVGVQFFDLEDNSTVAATKAANENSGTNFLLGTFVAF